MANDQPAAGVACWSALATQLTPRQSWDNQQAASTPAAKPLIGRKSLHREAITSDYFFT